MCDFWNVCTKKANLNRRSFRFIEINLKRTLVAYTASHSSFFFTTNRFTKLIYPNQCTNRPSECRCSFFVSFLQWKTHIHTHTNPINEWDSQRMKNDMVHSIHLSVNATAYWEFVLKSSTCEFGTSAYCQFWKVRSFWDQTECYRFTEWVGLFFVCLFINNLPMQRNWITKKNTLRFGSILWIEEKKQNTKF